MSKENVIYKKIGDDYVPITFNEVCSKDWSNKLIIAKVGSDSYIPSQKDIEEMYDVFANADALDGLKNMSLIVTPIDIKINIIDSVKNLKNQHVLVEVHSDDISIYKEIKNAISDNTKAKVHFVPVMTIEEYDEYRTWAKNNSIRKKRRGTTNY